MLNNRVANGRGMLCDNVVCAWGGGGGGLRRPNTM